MQLLQLLDLIAFLLALAPHQRCIGLLLVLFAGLLAVMTAIAGVLLASAALFMRYAGRKGIRPQARDTAEEPLILDARRTPRGWTVE